MKNKLKEIEEQLVEDIFFSLMDIQKEQDEKLHTKALIADFLAHKLVLKGYRKVEPRC